MKSDLAEYAEQQLIESAKRMTREERLAAFIEHSRLLSEFYRAGLRLRTRAAAESKESSHRP